MCIFCFWFNPCLSFLLFCIKSCNTSLVSLLIFWWLQNWQKIPNRLPPWFRFLCFARTCFSEKWKCFEDEVKEGTHLHGTTATTTSRSDNVTPVNLQTHAPSFPIAAAQKTIPGRCSRVAPRRFFLLQVQTQKSSLRLTSANVEKFKTPELAFQEVGGLQMIHSRSVWQKESIILVLKPLARSAPFSLTSPRSLFHTHSVIALVATHPKSCQVVCLISIQSERLHEQGDSFIKSWRIPGLRCWSRWLGLWNIWVVDVWTSQRALIWILWLFKCCFIFQKGPPLFKGSVKSLGLHFIAFSYCTYLCININYSVGVFFFLNLAHLMDFFPPV